MLPLWASFRMMSLPCLLPIISTPTPFKTFRRGLVSLPTRGRVLSIQSHVVSGYVGNKAVTFPLQLLGFDVDPLNTTQLSNHTGYRTHPGPLLQSTELSSIFAGLQRNGLFTYTHLLTGFVGSPSVLRTLAGLIPQLREANPSLSYFCDPVLGDNGQMYVPRESVEIYRDLIIPHADLLKPNHYECELLTGIRPESIDSALQICNHLHTQSRVKSVLISSLLPSAAYHDELLVLLSWNFGAQQFLLEIPRIDAYFTGTGDLLSSQILAWTTIHPDNIPLALEKSVATVHHVISETHRLAGHSVPSDQYPPPELQLIPCRDFIQNPQVDFMVTELYQT